MNAKPWDQAKRKQIHAVHCLRSGNSSVVVVWGHRRLRSLYCICTQCDLSIVHEMWFEDTGAICRCWKGDRNAWCCKALLGVHAFSGCDTVSAFTSRGKLLCLRLMGTDDMETLTQLGMNWTLSDALFASLESLTFRIYSASSNTDSFNDLHFSIFCAKKRMLIRGNSLHVPHH